VLLGLFLLLSAVLMHYQARRQGLKKLLVPVFLGLALPLSLFFARLIFSLVRFEEVFLNEFGEFRGLQIFFQPETHGFSIIGTILGTLLAGFFSSRLLGHRPGSVLDSAAAPSALLIALARLIEPLNGQGYGEPVSSPYLGFFPLSLTNDWGERLLSVSFIEGVLALALFAVLIAGLRRLGRPGMKALFFLVFFSLSQILPESWRRDDVLFIFIFARVTQVGYAALFAGAVAYLGVLAVRRDGMSRALLCEWLLTALGVLVCVGCEFALDKTNLPDLLVYLVMASTLLGMALITWRRMLKVGGGE
jgi:prolipoprotein diacylglyceryltransferase